MDKQDFINAGYKEYPPPFGRESAQYLLQKRICDDIGTRYFINAYFYLIFGQDSCCGEVQLTKNKRTFNIEINNFDSVEEVEQEIASIWQHMKFDYKDRA